MPRRWTNGPGKPAAGARLRDLENEVHNLWEKRKQREHERRFGNFRNPFTQEPREDNP